jgi:hypothetical protein
MRGLVVAATVLGALAFAAAADEPGPTTPPPAASQPHKHKQKHEHKAAAAPPKVSVTCTTDDECAFTTMADGQCCPSLCQPRAVSKASAEALDKYAAVCEKPHGECPVTACAPSRLQRQPACVSGKCVARAAPTPGRE